MDARMHRGGGIYQRCLNLCGLQGPAPHTASKLDRVHTHTYTGWRIANRAAVGRRRPVRGRARANPCCVHLARCIPLGMSRLRDRALFHQKSKMAEEDPEPAAGIAFIDHPQWGRSLIAARPFEAGDIVLKERPLLLARRDEPVRFQADSRDLPPGVLRCAAAFARASPETKAAVLSELYVPADLEAYEDTTGVKVGGACPLGMKELRE